MTKFHTKNGKMNGKPFGGEGTVPDRATSAQLPEVSKETVSKETVSKTHSSLMEKLWDMWEVCVNTNKDVDAVVYSRIMVVSATQMGAMIGVDAMLTEEQFIAICRENFKEAYRRAPKFS